MNQLELQEYLTKSHKNAMRYATTTGINPPDHLPIPVVVMPYLIRATLGTKSDGSWGIVITSFPLINGKEEYEPSDIAGKELDVLHESAHWIQRANPEIEREFEFIKKAKQQKIGLEEKMADRYHEIATEFFACQLLDLRYDFREFLSIASPAIQDIPKLYHNLHQFYLGLEKNVTEALCHKLIKNSYKNACLFLSDSRLSSLRDIIEDSARN